MSFIGSASFWFSRLGRICSLALLAVVLAVQACSTTTSAELTGSESAAVSKDWLQDGSPLPPDPLIQSGTLGCGIKWYILPLADMPVQIRLRVGVGSLAETQEERGIAHFIEHMAFNGSRQFPQGITQYIRGESKIRANAHTGFQETQYYVGLPSGDPSSFDTGLRIIRDYTDGLLFDPVEVDKERKVVLEDLRQKPLSTLAFIDFLAGSVWFKQLNGADPSRVEAASPQLLRSFYQRWYRPERMSIVVVGNVQAQLVREALEQAFADYIAPADAGPALPSPPPLDNPDPVRVKVEQVADSTSISISVDQRLNNFRPGTQEALQEQVVRLVLEQLSQIRWARLGKQKSWALAELRSYGYELLSGSPWWKWRLQLMPGKEGLELGASQAFDQWATEMERMARYGFSTAEWEVAKPLVLETLKQIYPDTWTGSTDDIALRIVNASAAWTDCAAPVLKRSLALEFLDGLDLDRINQEAARWFDPGLAKVQVKAPTGMGGSPEDFSSVLDGLESAYIGALDLPEPKTDLDVVPPQAGAVIQRISHQRTGIQEWQLSNGSRVLWLKCPGLADDQFQFWSYKDGGLSSLTEELVIPARLALLSLAYRGMGGLSPLEFQSYALTHQVKAGMYADAAAQGFAGGASVWDLEWFLPLIHACAASEPVSKQELDSVRNQYLQELNSIPSNPGYLRTMTIADMPYTGQPRQAAMGSHLKNEDLAQVNLDAVPEAWKGLFGSYGGTTWVFVGNFDAQDLESQVCTWLASLPGNPSDARPVPELPARIIPPGYRRQIQGEFPGAAVLNHVVSGQIQQGSWKDVTMARLAWRSLDESLMAQVREETGLSYSPHAYLTWDMLTPASWQISTYITCDAANRTQIDGIFYALCDKLTQLPPAPEDLNRWLKSANDEFRSYNGSIGGSMDLLQWVLKSGRSLDQPYDRARVISDISPEEFRAWCAAHISSQAWASVLLLPKSP